MIGQFCRRCHALHLCNTTVEPQHYESPGAGFSDVGVTRVQRSLADVGEAPRQVCRGSDAGRRMG